MAARWRKQPSEKGLARVCQGPRGYELYEDGTKIMWVSFASARYGHNDKWYYVGLGRNSFGEEMFDTKEQARDAATAFYKEHKKRSAT